MAVVKQKSRSVSHRRNTKAKDERVRRTRARIDAAFVELLHRRAYGDIRISDLTKKAGVGRATFYAHYATKDDLLRAQLQRITPLLLRSSRDPCLIDARPLFEHVRHATRLFLSLLGPDSGNAPRITLEFFAKHIRESLALELKPENNLELKQVAIARLVASSLFTLIECWLERGSRESPEQMQSLFSDLVGPGLRAGARSRA